MHGRMDGTLLLWAIAILPRAARTTTTSATAATAAATATTDTKYCEGPPSAARGGGGGGGLWAGAQDSIAVDGLLSSTVASTRSRL